MYKLATVDELVSRGTQKDKVRSAIMRMVARWTLGAIGFALFVLITAYSILIAPDWVFWTYVSSLIALCIFLFVRGR